MRDAKHSSACRHSFAFWKGLSLLSKFRERSSNQRGFLFFRASGGTSKRRSAGPSFTVMFAAPSWLSVTCHPLTPLKLISHSVRTFSRLHRSLAFRHGN